MSFTSLAAGAWKRINHQAYAKWQIQIIWTYKALMDEQVFYDIEDRMKSFYNPFWSSCCCSGSSRTLPAELLEGLRRTDRVHFVHFFLKGYFCLLSFLNLCSLYVLYGTCSSHTFLSEVLPQFCSIWCESNDSFLYIRYSIKCNNIMLCVSQVYVFKNLFETWAVTLQLLLLQRRTLMSHHEPGNHLNSLQGQICFKFHMRSTHNIDFHF